MNRLLLACLLVLAAIAIWYVGAPKSSKPATEEKSAPTPAKVEAAQPTTVEPPKETGGAQEDAATVGVRDRYEGLPVLEVRESARSEGTVKRIERLSLVRKDDFKYPLIRVKEEWVEDAAGKRRVSQVAMVADHVLMKPTDPALDETAVLSRLVSLGGTLRKKMPSSGIWLVSFPEPDLDTIPDALAEAAKHRDLILYAEPDYVAHASIEPDDTSFGTLWGMNNTGQSRGTEDADIDAPEAWELHTGSRTVRVGVIDTGIDFTHPELSANIGSNAAEASGTPGIDDDGNGYIDDIRGWDFANDDNNPIDDHNHGTHVSGTIGALGNNGAGVAGVCWQVSLVPLKFLDASGSGATSDAAEAIAYATALGVDLTSNSWGGGGFSQTLKDVIDEAHAAGKLFIAAAGNESSNNDTVGSYPANYDSPNLISVASTTRTDALSSFSNYGAATVHLGAPGSEILSTVVGGNFATFNGTSMATPHVAGTCALLKAFKPDLTHLEIREIILQTVDFVPALETTTITGGRLNAHEAMQAASGLTVSPATPFVSEGPDGGPFNPSSRTYTLTNRDTSPLSWTASSDQAWIALTPTLGSLNPGESVTVTAAMQIAAEDLSPDEHVATLSFETVTSGRILERQVSLTVTPPVVASFELETDPGWTRTGQWDFGTPLGQGGLSYGFPDPESGYTGSKVLGVNLSGDYSIGLGGPYYLTAGPFDFSKRHTTSLRYRRWLNTDYQPWVSANVEVSTNGSTWTTIWTNGGFSVTDNAWVRLEHDLSTIADREEEVWIRWSYGIGSTGAFPLSGWNLDDITLFGIPTAILDLENEVEVTENGATVTMTMNVDPAPAEDFTVDLTVSDAAQLTVPASVQVLAGETSVQFDVTAVDDALLDGTQIVRIDASAAEYIGGSTQVAVHDNESTILSLALPASVTEGSGALSGQGTVTLADAVDTDVLVHLASNDAGEMQVPATVTVASGAMSATFDLLVPDDGQIDGTQPVTITAAVTGWTGDSATVDVEDNESLNLVVTLPSAMLEGQATTTGQVRLAGTLPTALVVTLTNSAPTQLAVPGSVTIPAGQIAVSFTATPVDNSLVDGVQSVQITASSAGFVDGSAVVLVYDNETPALATSPFPADQEPRTHPQSNLAWNYDSTTGGAPNNADIWFGTQLPLEEDDLLANTTQQSYPLATLTPGTTYYWQIHSAIGGVKTTAPVWQFTVPPIGEVARYQWSALSSEQLVDSPIPVTITAYDDLDNVVTPWNGPATLAPTSVPTTMVISEVNPNSQDAIELTNVSGQGVDLSGWTLWIYDVDSQPNPKTPFVFPDGAVCAAGETVTVTEFGTAPGAAPNFFFGANINWTANSIVGLMLQRPDNSIADFMCGGALSSGAIAVPLPIPPEQWSGPPADVPIFDSLTYHRQGESDLQGAEDWIAAAPSIGTLNSALIVPFPGTLVDIEIDPNDITFSEGVWSGNVRVRQPVPVMSLSVTDAADNTGKSNLFEVVSSGTLTLTLSPTEASEGDGTLVNVATVSLSLAVGVDVTVALTPDDLTEMSPTTVTILAGELSGTGPLEIVDDALLDGSRQVRIEATAPAFNRSEATFTVNDDESAELTLTLPPVMTEDQGVLAGEGLVEVSEPVDEDVSVTLTSQDESELVVPPSVTILAGTTSATFDLTAVDDQLLDGAITVDVNASVSGWTGGLAQVEVRDNEAPNLSLTVPAEVSEGDGLISGSVGLTGEAVEAITVALSSSNVTDVGVPASVTIPAGASSAAFDLNVADDPDTDGNFSVTITATATGLTQAFGTVVVLDNDAAEIQIADVTGPQKEGIAFTVSVTALDINDQPLKSVAAPVTLSAAGDLGPLAVEPSELKDFVDGVWSGNVRILSADMNVVLTVQTPTASGVGNAFDVDQGARVQVNPASVTGEVASGFSTTTLVTIHNAGADPLTWTGTETASWLALDAAGGTIPAGGSLPVTVNLNATALPAGEVTTDWTIQSNDGVNPVLVVPISLTVKPGLDHFEWAPIPGPQFIGTDIPVTVTARDIHGELIPEFVGAVNFEASGTGGLIEVPIGAGTFNASRPMNTTFTEGRTQMIYLSSEIGGAGDITSMSLDVATAPSSPVTNVVIRMKTVPLDEFNADIAWHSTDWTTVYQGSLAPTNPGWFEIPFDSAFSYDGVNHLFIDVSYQQSTAGTASFFRSFNDDSAIRVLHYAISDGGAHPQTWTGTNPFPYSYTFRPNLKLAITNGFLPMSPDASGNFVGGTWNGIVRVDAPATDVMIRARGVSGKTGISNGFDVISATDLIVTLPTSATEGDGVLTDAGIATINPTLATDLSINLVSNDPSEITVPASVTILAGETSASFDITVVDDALLDGTRPVTVSSTAPGTLARESAPMDIADNEVTTLSVQGLVAVVEGEPEVTAQLVLGNPVSETLVATITSADPTLLLVPTEVTFAKNTSSTNFTLSSPDNAYLDGPQTVSIHAALGTLISGSADVEVSDDESQAITLEVTPGTFGEADGVVPDAGQITLGGLLRMPRTITVISGDTAEVANTSVVVPAESSAASFDLTILNDIDTDGTQTVALTAAIPGLVSGQTSILVRDDDAHHFVFSTVVGPKFRSVTFPVTILARTVDGQAATGFNGAVSLHAALPNLSLLPVTPTTTTAFVAGGWSGEMSVDASGTGVSLAAEDGDFHSGTSNAFDVVADEDPPMISISTPANGFTLAESATILGSASDSGSGVSSVTVSGSAVTALGALGPGDNPFASWSYATPSLHEGENSFVIVATDAAQPPNSGSVAWTITRIIDAEDDTDGNGIPALLEKAFAIGEEGSQGGLPTTYTGDNPSDSKAYLMVNYHRRIQSGGFRYLVETSTNMDDWSAIEGDVEVLGITPNGDGLTETCVIRIHPAIGDIDGKFVRVRVELD